MNTAYFLSGLALEILVRPQSEKGLFLPGDGEIEKADDNELIYGIHNMLEDGVLIPAADGKGFEVSEALEPVVRSVINAKSIIKAYSHTREYPKYFYVCDEQTAIIDPVFNRSNSYRVTVIENEILAETIRSEMDLPGEETDISEIMESYQEKTLSGEYVEDTEKDILLISGDTPAEDAVREDGVMSVIDTIDSYSGEQVSRWVIYKVSTFEKAITITPHKTEAPQIYSYSWLEENIKLALEAKNDNS